jgi:tRNA modification GTPase
MPTPSPATAPVRVALLTSPGRGALAVIGITGPGSCDLADRRFRPRRGSPLAHRPAGSIASGTWHAQEAAPGEELVVVRHARDRLEVHCHGGLAAAEAVLSSLTGLGAICEPWPAWLAATGAGVIEVEAREALAVAAGPRAGRILSRQLAGVLAAELDRIGSLATAADRRAATDRLLRAARVGLRLAKPWRVVLAGPVNAGKSSLVNALAGYARSVVTPEPGTTRDLVTARLVLGGWDIEVCDTAGERPPDEAVSATERAGIARAAEARGHADLVLQVRPAGSPLPPPARPRELVVVAKTDLVSEPVASPAGGVVTSSVTGRGIDNLAAAIVAALVPEHVAEPGLLAGPVPFTQRQIRIVRGLAEGPRVGG